MHKSCPFCKKKVDSTIAVCPHCTRVLRETIYTNKSNYYSQTNQRSASNDEKSNIKNKLTSFLKLQIGKFKKLLSRNKVYVVGHNKQDRYKIFILIFIAFLFFIGLYTEEARIPVSNPISVPNGSVLSQNSYYINGFGELQIKNGNYKLFFNLGNDWDSEIKAFTVNSGYEVFEDLFDFTTGEHKEGDYIRTEYSTFEVTLNPVIGGSAETENVSMEEFAIY